MTVMVQLQAVKEKVCPKCGEPMTGKQGKYWRCKPCWNAYMRKWKEKNRVHHLSYVKQYRKQNPHIYKNGMLKAMYGITLEQFADLSEQQDHACAICGRKEIAVDPRTGRFRNLAVDHDHETGQVRGLLCSGCNMAIGMLNTKELLEAAMTYLEETREVTT